MERATPRNQSADLRHEVYHVIRFVMHVGDLAYTL